MEYRWKKALVRVWDGDPYDGGTYVGTAFFIAPGYLLTAKHVVTVVKDYQQIFLLHPFGAWDGSFVTIDAPIPHPHDQVDIAILPVKKQVQREYCLAFAPEDKADLNAGVKVNLGGFSTKDGSSECMQVQISAHYGKYDLDVTHTSVAKGLSGGPVLYNDEVVAVVCARDEKDGTKTYLERLNSFRDFLDEHLHNRSAVRLVQPISIKDLDELKHLLGHIQISDEKVNRVFLQAVPGSRHPDNCINQSYFFTILDFLAQKKCVKPDQAPLLYFLEYLQQDILQQLDDELSDKLSAWKERIAGRLGMDIQAIRGKCRPIRNAVAPSNNTSSLLLKIEPYNFIHKDKFILTAWLYHQGSQYSSDPEPLDIPEHVFRRKDLDVAVKEVLDEGFKKFGGKLHVEVIQPIVLFDWNPARIRRNAGPIKQSLGSLCPVTVRSWDRLYHDDYISVRGRWPEKWKSCRLYCGIEELHCIHEFPVSCEELFRKLNINERLFVSLSVFPENSDHIQQLFGTMLAAGLAVLFWPLEPFENFNALHQALKDCLSGQDNCLWPRKIYQRRRERDDWNDLLMLYDNPNCLPPDVNYPGIAPYE